VGRQSHGVGKKQGPKRRSKKALDGEEEEASAIEKMGSISNRVSPPLISREEVALSV